MSIQTFYRRICLTVSNYNLFISKETDYHDDASIQDPLIIRKQQQYKTWLYIILLAGKDTYAYDYQMNFYEYFSVSLFIVLRNFDKNGIENDYCIEDNTGDFQSVIF